MGIWVDEDSKNVLLNQAMTDIAVNKNEVFPPRFMLFFSSSKSGLGSAKPMFCMSNYFHAFLKIPLSICLNIYYLTGI